MRRYLVTLGALLLAAPVFSQENKPAEHEALQFQLREDRTQVEQRMGRPAVVAEFGEFESWQYQIGIEDHHEFSHQLVFRAATGELISFTRNYEPAEAVDVLFPEAESRVEHYPDAQHSAMVVRVRHMQDGRVLIAIGSGGQGQPAAQVMSIRESELRFFYPWLLERLAKR